jgi:hypothetical protein
MSYADDSYEALMVRRHGLDILRRFSRPTNDAEKEVCCMFDVTWYAASRAGKIRIRSGYAEIIPRHHFYREPWQQTREIGG